MMNMELARITHTLLQTPGLLRGRNTRPLRQAFPTSLGKHSRFARRLPSARSFRGPQLGILWHGLPDDTEPGYHAKVGATHSGPHQETTCPDHRSQFWIREEEEGCNILCLNVQTEEAGMESV